MIPTGWKKCKLGGLFEKRTDRGKSGLPVLSVTLNNGLVQRDSIDRKMDTNLTPEEHLLVKKNDIAYNMMRMWQGASGIASYDGIISPAYIVLKPQESIDPQFAAHWFKSARMIYLFWAYSYGLTGDRLRLYFKDLSLIPVTLPPLSEQKTIADLLTTWDSAIEKTERLIKAKEKRFSWLLNKLINEGSVKGDWRKVKLGLVGEISSAGVDKKSSQGEIPVRLVNYLDVYRRDMIYSHEVSHFVTASPNQAKRCSVKKGDIFFTPSSEVRDDIGHSAVAMEDIPDAVYSYHIVRLRLQENWDLFYRAYAFKSQNFFKQAQKLCDGSGQRYVISQNNFRNMEVSVPPFDQQKQIATVLNTAQQEIELLKKQLEAYRKQKRGLMQKLLTGQWRVK